MVDPMWMKSRIEHEDPSRDIPYKAIELPMRRKLRKDRVLPILMKSRIASEDPSRVVPYTLRQLPIRTKLRRLVELGRDPCAVELGAARPLAAHPAAPGPTH